MEGGPIAEQPLELIRSMFDINVFGALELAQGFIKKNFVAKRSGKIVFTSSMGGLWTVPYVAAYCCLQACTGSHCRRTENRTGTIW